MFTQAAEDPEARIIAIISGLTAGEHAVKIHESGDLSAGCSGAGAIYNPLGVDVEADPEARPVGDLGTVTADSEGVARLDLRDPLV